MKDSIAIALRLLSRVAENLKIVEKKIDDPERILLGVIARIEARMAEAQKDHRLTWYEINDEDRLAAQRTGQANMEF